MSRYFSEKYSALTPYTPGEQPKDRKFVKLNTNESPFPPSPLAQEYAAKAAANLQLYSEIGCTKLCEKLASLYGIEKENILFTNGSDEAHPAAFPDITYGFYPVFARLNHVPYEEIPLDDDLSLNVADYLGNNRTLFIANPNAPTGVALPLSEIERIVASNPGNVVVVDEAYIDFGGESAVSLIKKYDNLLVTQTFSKSRSMAGARLGMGIANPDLIRDLST